LVDRFWGVLIALGLHGPLLSARTFWGERIEVTFPDYRCIYHHGLIDGREFPVEHFLVHFLEEGDVCIDVGANVGFYTTLFSVLVGKSGKVYAFEPTPRTFSILTRNTARKANVVLINKALMEGTGKRDLIDYGVERSGLNAIALSPSEEREASHLLSVDAITLDSYCSAHNVRPTFIKIDTEGAEKMVLTGGRHTLIEQRPVLIVEVQRESPQEVVALLGEYGYKAYKFIGNNAVPYVEGQLLQCPNMLFRHESDSRKIELYGN
jgi:FkbM family methyltransferase